MKLRFIIFSLFFINQAYSTNYYLDSFIGQNSNDGLSSLTAWRSIDQVNNFQFTPGDSILFKRGAIFRGNLIPQSGTASKYITYGAFGVGDKPLLLGSIQKNDSSDWINEFGNIWSTTSKRSTSIGQEILHNADFDLNCNYWYKWDNKLNGASSELKRAVLNGQYFSKPGGGMITCASNGISKYDLQVSTSNYSLLSSTLYMLTFWAKSSKPFTMSNGTVQIIKNAAPYTSYSNSISDTLAIDTIWKRYELFFESIYSANDAQIVFLLGSDLPSNTSFFFDSLSFKRINSSNCLLPVDVGNIIFNNESFCGIKVWSPEDLKTQNQFWYDTQNHLCKMYSNKNPGKIYSNIELALNMPLINNSNKSYLVFENLELKYSGASGIGNGQNTNHIVIKNTDFSYLGGGVAYGDPKKRVRYGNGIEFWESSHDNSIENCSFNQIFDAAITIQGEGKTTPYQVSNIIIKQNLIRNCEYSFELWARPNESILRNIYFENNTCLFAGNGWGHSQRPDPNGTHLMIFDFPAKSVNISIRNNIFCFSTDYLTRWSNKNEIKKVDLDYNCWYQLTGPVANIQGTLFDFNTQWELYKISSAQDKNSIAKNPLLTNYFTLSKDSPCIESGLTTLTDTINSDSTFKVTGTKCDIGASVFKGGLKKKK